MDASILKVAATAPIHIKNTAGEPLYDDAERTKPVRIIVHSPGSLIYATIEARRTQRSLKRLNENDGKITAPTAEENIAEIAEDLASATVSFENLTYGDKTGAELFLSVYRDPELGYIARQVNKFLADWGNFKPASAAS